MAETVEKKTSGFGTAGLVLGIIAVIFSFIPIISYISFIFGGLAFIFSVVSLIKKASKGVAIAGLVLSIIAIFMANAMHQGVKEVVNDIDKSINSEVITELRSGESTTADDVKITYVSSNNNYTKYNEYDAPSKENKVVRLQVKFENTSSSNKSLDGFTCYANNEKCEEYYSVDDYKSPSLESISAGKSFTAIVYFEVPKDASKIIVEYEPNFLNKDKVIFNIK